MSYFDVVYLDMDGVLVNHIAILDEFEYNDGNYGGVEGIELQHKDEPNFNVHIHLIEKHLNKHPFIWAPKMPNFDQVVDLVQLFKNRTDVRFEILSSGTKQDNLYDEIVRQKSVWLSRHFPYCDVHHFSKGASAKYKMAHPRALLIDDYDRNCEQFTAAGGHAYHYKHWVDLTRGLIKSGYFL